MSDRDGLRKSIGVCPQFDILYDDLNCQEQLELFGKVHGLSPEQASGEATRLLEIFQLKEKANKLTKTLSGVKRDESPLRRQ